MRRNFDYQLQELQEMLLKMGALVENIIELAIDSLVKQDVEMADRVIILDDKADKMEVEIEIKCLELIALQQPKAKDLRKISSILKIITDLERIGDHGVNISKATKKMSNEKYIKPLIDIPKMANHAKMMIKKSLDSFVKEDVKLAEGVANTDDIVDDIYESMYVELLEMLSKDKSIMNQVIDLLFIGRYIERIADHTTNICERVIYMVTSERVEF
ncbi:phosphate signaling complex protein PhoU [Clostridiisalibacter paucivorans]|uniref:phosphate signaling complex protein PhoU n=1 Tax=Clostridiisalibacter paucivorans TaxID=408753 RepID=UPI00047A047F|nr:phosphate signaling complex protein PhoU [Clostridiisalibacter paucivorans]